MTDQTKHVLEITRANVELTLDQVTSLDSVDEKQPIKDALQKALDLIDKELE